MRKKPHEYSSPLSLEEALASAAARPATERRPVSTVQPKSTQDILDGKVAKDRPWPPTGWLAVSSATNMDEAVPARPLSPQDVRTFPKSKNSYAGDSAPSITPERKHKAENAFLYSGHAVVKPEDLKRVVGLTPYKSEAPIIALTTNKKDSGQVYLEKVQGLSTFQRIRNWILRPFMARWKGDL